MHPVYTYLGILTSFILVTFAAYAAATSIKVDDSTSIRPIDHFEVIGSVGVANLWTGSNELGVTSSETDRLQTSANLWN